MIPEAERACAVELVDEACIAGARRAEACGILGITLRTLQRWQHPGGTRDGRPEAIRIPSNQLTPTEREEVIMISNSEKYRDLPPCKIVPMLADEGCYIASESTFYRILKEIGQMTHRGIASPVRYHRPRVCAAHAPNQVWSWDISYLPTQVRGLYFYLYMIMDIYSRKIVGWRIHGEESSAHAANLVTQACVDEAVPQGQLTLHQDNGAPMKGATLRATLEKLGVLASFSRPSVSDDNPYSESLFRTLKYRPEFPCSDGFATLAEATAWCELFVDWYNHQHLHSGIKFITPSQRHEGKDKPILARRHEVYEAAKVRHPLRWSGETRNWILPDVVTLNPDRKGRTLIQCQEQTERAA